ncbi:MAG: uncharacterized protein KVP18_003284 [Porospora cf. gigantea A]|nr:MAG: hypothetical protein KVP18_003284 [Porospora cf. gigantea A]
MRRDDLIASLVEQVAIKFGLRSENVVLQKGDDAFDHTCTLRFTHVNLANGDVLKMTSVDGTVGEMQGVTTGLKACRSTADLVPEQPQTSSPAFEVGDHAAAGGPAFLNFDEYLHRSMFNIGDLPLLQNFKPRLLERGQLTKVPPSVTLRHQKYRHVDHIEFMNVEAMNKFVTHWRYDLEMSEQRCGYLYGYYREDPHYPQGIRAVVEAIYEPQQVGEVDTCTVLDDEFLPTVNTCAEALGLECVGFIYTQLPGNHHATNTEVLRQASLQLEHSSALHYTGYEHSTFVTVTVSPDTDLGGEPVPNAYMVSDLGMAFYRDGLFDKVQPNPNLMNIKQGAPHELFPKVLESGKLIEAGGSFDLDWLLVRVNDSAPKTVNSFFKHNSFPPMNRRRAPTQRDVQTYLKNVSGPDWTRLSDFHFLLYVAHLFDVNTGKAICDCVRNKKVNMSDFLDILNLL